jgi:small subunit ribosomal protein S1
VTKVVTFGAFVEVIPGVEGLVHISELAAHHVENPREVVQQGETLRAKIIEMDAERRRLSLSLKRVEEGESVRPGVGGEAPDLGLSEEVFVEGAADPAEAEPEAAAEVEEIAEVIEVEDALEELEQPEAEAAPAVEVEPEQAEESEEPAAESEPAVAAEGLSDDEAAPEGEASVGPDDEQR